MEERIVVRPQLLPRTSATVQPPVSKPALDGLSPAAISRRSRSFFGNRFVYAVISQRASGLSIGVNLNPDRYCNFDCAYCEIDRTAHPLNADKRVDTDVLSNELKEMLGRAFSGKMRELSGYERVPDELLNLKEVALSGDGEPTLCPNFAEVVETVAHLRAQCLFPFFKVVLITNATGLHLPEVQLGLRLFTSKDEIWAKLENGTETEFDAINRPIAPPHDAPATSLDHVLKNILATGKQRPIIIQSLFPAIDGKGPSPEEIEAYVQRLQWLKNAGAQIALVQVYSAHRVAANPRCSHLPLRTLADIARRVRQVTGLQAEVF